MCFFLFFSLTYLIYISFHTSTDVDDYNYLEQRHHRLEKKVIKKELENPSISLYIFKNNNNNSKNWILDEDKTYLSLVFFFSFFFNFLFLSYLFYTFFFSFCPYSLILFYFIPHRIQFCQKVTYYYQFYFLLSIFFLLFRFIHSFYGSISWNTPNWWKKIFLTFKFIQIVNVIFIAILEMLVFRCF